jgi:hypothetical protein
VEKMKKTIEELVGYRTTILRSEERGVRATVGIKLGDLGRVVFFVTVYHKKTSRMKREDFADLPSALKLYNKYN